MTKVTKEDTLQLTVHKNLHTCTGAASFAWILVTEPKISWDLSLLSWNFTHLEIWENNTKYKMIVLSTVIERQKQKIKVVLHGAVSLIVVYLVPSSFLF